MPASAPRPSTAPGALTLTRRQGWTLAIVATLTMAVSYVDRQVLAAIAPSVQAALHLNNTQYGWIQSAFSFAYLAGAPIAGLLLDRAGARSGLIVAAVLWSLVAAGHALAPSFAVLFALRIALGLSEAPSFPGAAQVVHRVLPRAERSAGFGILFTGSSIGSVIAAPLALKLDARFGWQGAFIGTALVGATWIPVWILVTRSRAAREVLTARPRDKSAPSPSYLKVLSEPAVLRALVFVCASAPAHMFVLLWFPKYLYAAFALPKPELARYLWMPPLFMDIGAVVFGVVASLRERARARLTHDPRPRIQSDLLVLAAVATATLALVPLAGGPWGATVLGAATLTGVGALYGRLTADMSAQIPPEYVSTAGGFAAAAQSLVYIVANPLVGRLTDGYGLAGYHWALVALGVIAIPCALIGIAWPVRRAPVVEQPPAV